MVAISRCGHLMGKQLNEAGVKSDEAACIRKRAGTVGSLHEAYERVRAKEETTSAQTPDAVR